MLAPHYQCWCEPGCFVSNPCLLSGTAPGKKQRKMDQVHRPCHLQGRPKQSSDSQCPPGWALTATSGYLNYHHTMLHLWCAVHNHLNNEDLKITENIHWSIRIFQTSSRFKKFSQRKYVPDPKLFMFRICHESCALHLG